MKEFAYLVTLKSGAFSVATNGIFLDRLVAERWEDVKTIEVLSKDDPRITES